MKHFIVMRSASPGGIPCDPIYVSSSDEQKALESARVHWNTRLGQSPQALSTIEPSDEVLEIREITVG
jgi:hypothetical protein